MDKITRERYEAAMLAWERKRSPNIPEHLLYSFVDKTSANSANGLTKCVINYLMAQGWQAERINTMGRPVDTRKKYKDVIGQTREVGSITWIPGTGTKGSADISATIRGRSVKIEIKFGRDRQSEAQRAYEQDVTAAGGVYIIVRDMDGFLRWYDQFIKL